MDPQSAPMTESDERMWAMLSHLSILLNLVSGFLGTVAVFVIYLVYKDRSRFVTYHSWQALIFQLVAWVLPVTLAGISWFLSSILVAVLIGVLCIPISCLLSLVPIASIVYGIVAAVQVNQGEDFKYWLVGDWEFVREKSVE